MNDPWWSLSPSRPAPSDDAAALALHEAAQGRRFAILGAIVILIGAIGWWPLDRVVFADAHVVAQFGLMRQGLALLLVASLAVLVPLRPGTAGLRAAIVGTYALVLGWIGYALGGIGGPDFGWLGDAMLGLFPVALIPLPLGVRVVGTGVLAAALWAGFFLGHPENLAMPGAFGQSSFLVFATGVSVVGGETWTRVTRLAFHEGRALERANERYATLTDTLAEQVEERSAALRALAAHLDTVQETERRRIAHDLHDDLGQQLTAMRYSVARLQGRVGDEAAPLLEDLEVLLDGTSQSMRSVITRLRPRILDDLGLEAAVEWLCDEVSARGVTCRLVTRPGWEALGRVDPTLELALFRVVQEGTTNALKHAEPSSITVTLDADGASAIAEVVDDGVGIEDATGGGMGLLGLRERFRGLGGACTVERGAVGGTVLRASLPVQEVPA